MKLLRYLKDIFTSNGTGGSIDDELIDRCLSPEEAESLSQTYTADEVQIALKQLHPTKSPGYYLLHALFIQKYWHIVGS